MSRKYQDSELKVTIPNIFDIYPDDDVLWVDNESALRDANRTYRYVVITDYFETVCNPVRLIEAAKTHLIPNGTLLLTLNNPLGLRYFVGDKDPYTDRNFDSIESYLRVNKYDRQNLSGHMYDRAQIDRMLSDAGFGTPIQYSVFPNLKSLQLIYREDILPNEDISSRIIPLYNSPDTVFLDEYMLQRKLMENGMFHQFANAYILECHVCDSENMQNGVGESASKSIPDLKAIKTGKNGFVHATINLNRGLEYSMVTKIMENGEVVKRAVFPEGVDSLETLKTNHDELRKRGINAVKVTLKDNVALTDFVEGRGGIEYFQNLANKIYENKNGDSVNIDFLIKKVDEFRDIILKSSEHIIEEATGEILLKNGYPDLTLINCIYQNDEPIFFDQEYVIPNLPVKVLVLRLVDYVYYGNGKLESMLPRTFFDERYELAADADRWHRVLWKFLSKLKHEEELQPFYEKHCTRPDIANANRQRMNYSQAEYKALFDDIFAGLDSKELYVFGSGNFAERFVNLYGRFYDAAALVDNDETKWGQEKCGKRIISPAELISLDPSSYKVIICIKNYTAVLKQLRAEGVKNISVFDPNGVYAVQRKSNNIENDSLIDSSKACSITTHVKQKKPYNIGYIAGVFDLFHIGHLNLLRRAKEQCNHLIVGVVNDEAVIKNKQTTPFVPFAERIEMVRACRYVDEAVEITYTNAGTRDAFRMYHFDVQFSGSDYANNGNWLAEKEFLEKNGAELVFFPYTEQTSSTKIKKLIEEKLV